MAMTSEERSRFEKLERLVNTLLHVENLQFIKSVERNIDLNLIEPSGKAASAENISINEAGIATKSVLGPPDGWVKLGPNQNVPTYND